MRYRNRIRIAKGLYVNLSKSGVSLSAGIRGASVTVGKGGAYGNVGIPGSGIYDRKKIASFNSPKTQPENTSSFAVSVGITDDGQIYVNDEAGNLITDDFLLKRIKRTDTYKEAVKRIYQSKKHEIDAEFAKFIEIYKSTPEFLSADYWMQKVYELKHDIYMYNSFLKPEPTREIALQKITEKANMEVKSILFWTLKEKREKYVKDNVDECFTQMHKKWEHELKTHNEKEKDRELQIKNHNLEVDRQLTEIKEDIIKGNPDYIRNEIEKILNNIVLPVDFSLDYECINNCLLLDIDLPEIEDLPNSRS